MVDKKTPISNVTSYILFILVNLFFSNKLVISKFLIYVKKKEKFLKIQLYFLIIILYVMYFFKVGYIKEWNMSVFTGYSNTPHSLGYVLINLYFINECIYFLGNYKGKFNILLLMQV